MKIALIGYGKMGKTIHEMAESNGDEVVYIIDKENKQDLFNLSRDNTDVVIEFSNPESAYTNLKHCIENQIPIVSGTTGWLDKYEEIQALCLQKNATFMYASNFSIGVNIFFELNKYLADKMKNYQIYQIRMEEIHHTEKLDAPSGTAITIAEGIADKIARLGSIENIPIKSKRVGKTPGTHIVEYNSEIDSIEIKHTAHGRAGFAKGAFQAAHWIKDKKGVFSIQDMLFG